SVSSPMCAGVPVRSTASIWFLLTGVNSLWLRSVSLKRPEQSMVSMGRLLQLPVFRAWLTLRLTLRMLQSYRRTGHTERVLSRFVGVQRVISLALTAICPNTLALRGLGDWPKN